MPRALDLEELLDEDLDVDESYVCDVCPDADACELQGYCLLGLGTYLPDGELVEGEP